MGRGWENPTKMETKLTPKETDEYLIRIHYTGAKEPTIEALSELQRCHILSIPFENLSVFGKEEIILSKDWLFEKLMRRHRGGYCYELNYMLSLLLDYFGFNYNIHAASVFDNTRGTGNLNPPSHVVIVVNIDGQQWLTDVGFGDIFWTPLHFTGLGEQQEQPSGTYRIRKDGYSYIYEEKVKMIVDEFGGEKREKEPAIFANTEWVPRYQFVLNPKKIEDFHEWLIYNQTDPKSPFTHDRICTMAKPWGRETLSGSKLVTTTYLGGNKVKKETRELVGGEEEVVEELEQKFGIRRDTCFYPEGSMFYGVQWNN